MNENTHSRSLVPNMNFMLPCFSFQNRLFRIPEDTTAGRPASFPGTNAQGQGWWHRIVQFVSPRQVRQRSTSVSGDLRHLREPETGEHTSLHR